MTSDASSAAARPGGLPFGLIPGILASAAVAAAAHFAAPLIVQVVPVPAMVIALLAGMALNPVVTARPWLQPGMAFCVRTVLRWAVALLGLRIALTDIAGLGPGTAVLVVIAMTVTLCAGFGFARLSGRPAALGALAGAATAVCGASATLATASVVPDYRGKQADVAFVVVGVNALATAAILIYPPLCLLLGFDEQATGVMLGATIHDVAQVVGAGYAVSENAGNAAVIVKLFRVFLLLPVVLAVGWYFSPTGAAHGKASVPVPVFALVFLALCLVNSVVPHLGGLMPFYSPVQGILVEVSAWGLLLAIGALGLGTSLGSVAALGWWHVATLTGTTAIILVVVTTGLLVMGQH